jgi:hypothetical protein
LPNLPVIKQDEVWAPATPCLHRSLVASFSSVSFTVVRRSKNNLREPRQQSCFKLSARGRLVTLHLTRGRAHMRTWTGTTGAQINHPVSFTSQYTTAPFHRPVVTMPTSRNDKSISTRTVPLLAPTVLQVCLVRPVRPLICSTARFGRKTVRDEELDQQSCKAFLKNLIHHIPYRIAKANDFTDPLSRSPVHAGGRDEVGYDDGAGKEMRQNPSSCIRYVSDVARQKII